ncbi:MAG: antitoxin Xre-like helix-turn-helix domain-containing protein [Pseudomonadota bacterium]
MARVGIKAAARAADTWRLTAAQSADLVDVPQRTWARMRKGSWNGNLTRDQLLRLSAIAGLFKGLRLTFSDELADQWPTLPNTGPLFGGNRPVDVMIAGGLPSIMAVRLHIDAVRGGA